jgi:hypothetical protein
MLLQLNLPEYCQMHQNVHINIMLRFKISNELQHTPGLRSEIGKSYFQMTI